MFTRDDVTLRPLDIEDNDRAYQWHCDLDIEIASGWGRRQAPSTFQQRFEAFLAEPPDEHRIFGIVANNELVGRIDLSMVDESERHAMLGLFIGERDQWGKGYGSTAIAIMLDYAFTVENLDRVYAHVFDFNERSLGLMRRAGFTHEGTLRKHEIHNGARRDIEVFGMLRDEFYATNDTIFALPGGATTDQ